MHAAGEFLPRPCQARSHMTAYTYTQPFGIGACSLYFAGDLGIINLGSSLFTMKLQTFGAALILLLLVCSFGGHARVAPHVQSLYKTIEAKQRPVGDIWSDCSESMYEFIDQIHGVNNPNIDLLALIGTLS